MGGKEGVRTSDNKCEGTETQVNGQRHRRGSETWRAQRPRERGTGPERGKSKRYRDQEKETGGGELRHGRGKDTEA